jgi:hypothetical protein
VPVLPRAIALLTLVAALGVHAQSPAPQRTPVGVETAAEPARSPGNASYRITARLDPATRTITGEEVITWRNIASTAAPSLQFHLYYNAWRNDDSTWMRGRLLAGNTALAGRPDADRGSIDITAMRVTRGGTQTDLLAGLRFIAPDDGNAQDRTVVEAPLATPVAPGETIEIAVAWTSRVPRTYARTGAVGDFYFIAQWFPKIGVFEDAGWNVHQFHSATEFFADFGLYDVSLEVPSGWTVGATGREVERAEAGDRTIHRYQQADVHDFAWTTSPDYVERRARFEHPALPAVEMRLLLQPEHASQAERHFEATRAALRYYGEWYGPYPYGHITIVDPAWQSGAGGMEYPTLFTAGTRWLQPERAVQPESVTIHEAGHQFLYGIVATNEVEHAWMDEGLNTYTQARIMDESFSPQYYAKRYFGGFVPRGFRDLPLTREVDGNRMPAYRPVARNDAQATPTWQYWPGSASAISYNKTALWMHTLERMLGWETTQRILSTYFERHAFTHPKPDDFFAVANEVSGQDLTWFFDEVHRGAKLFDYSVDLVRRGERTTVVARRLGDGVFPVTVLLRLEDGSEQRWAWDGRDPWRAFEHAGAAPVSAEVDPDRILVLDVYRTNNSVTLEPAAPRAATKWSLAWLIWLQDHLLTYGFFV